MTTENLNPKKALDAIISQDIPVQLTNGETLVIKPISISTLAVLDSIGSPIVTGEKLSMLNFITTLYICINGYKAAFTTNPILQDALDYFDKLNITNEDFEKLRTAVLIQFEKIINIQPEQAADKKNENKTVIAETVS